MAGGLLTRGGLAAIVILLAAAPASARAQWGIVGTPQPRTNVGAMLSGTACPSATDCWAVGFSNNGTSTVSLVEHWDGASWTPVDTPAPATGDLVIYGLNAVTCAAADACWAVGSFYAGAGATRPLVEHWDGRSWSLVDAPGTGDTDALLGVTCTSSSDCWSVGYSFRSGWRSLVEHFNGSAWTRVASPDPFDGDTLAPAFNVLRSVACRSADDCWAAGYGKQEADYRALLAHWDGSRWSAATPAAAPGASDGALFGVACAPSTCWAVGLAGGPGNPTLSTTDPQVADPQPLIERLDAGTAAVATPVLPAGAGQAGLTGVACGGTGCVAVGYADDAPGEGARSLIERWDGTAWRASPAA